MAACPGPPAALQPSSRPKRRRWTAACKKPNLRATMSSPMFALPTEGEAHAHHDARRPCLRSAECEREFDSHCGGTARWRARTVGDLHAAGGRNERSERSDLQECSSTRLPPSDEPRLHDKGGLGDPAEDRPADDARMATR